MIERLAHTTAELDTFEWSCPTCRHAVDVAAGGADCPCCGSTFQRRAGIWDFLPEKRADAYAPFLEEYDVVRRREHWGGADGTYFRALPDVEPNDPHRDIWRLRARTFRCFVNRIVRPMEVCTAEPLRVIDLGAGNGWLAYRLAVRGHLVAAADVRTDALDGLGASVHYDADFVPVRAEFDRLPFSDAQFNLAVFSASLHYSPALETTIREAMRVLRPKGTLVILDSPLYRREGDGRRMVRERKRHFLVRYGFASDALDSEHFLTRVRLNRIAESTGLVWKYFRLYPGMSRISQRIKARMLGRHEPACFPVIASLVPDRPLQRIMSIESPQSSAPERRGAST